MPSEVMDRVIRAPFKRVAELVRTSMARQGWRIELINEALLQITASQQKQERLRETWRYRFEAVVSWRRQGEDVKVIVEVAERENTWTTDKCSAMCQEVLEGIEQNASLLEEVEKHQEPSTTYGAARWATEEDFEKAGYINSGDSRRLVLGPYNSARCLTLPAAETAKHALICGPTGCGKSSSIFIPNLIQRVHASAIVTEATAGNEAPDLYLKTGGWRETAGPQKIYYFNPDDLSSDRINPLDAVNSIDQAQNIAALIVQNTSKKFSGGDPIWETSERHLLTALILHVAAKRGHLGDVRVLMKEGPEGMGAILENSSQKTARSEYMAFFKNSSEGFRNGVTSGLMQRLNLWINPKIVALTEKTDIDLEGLSEELFTFYLAVPAQKTHLKPLASLVLNFILDLALQKHFKHPLFLSLDEFTNFGYIPAIADKLTIIRHRGIAAMIGIQDYIQMEKAYGREDATILFGQPATKVFFKPGDNLTARKISESLGKKTVVDRKLTSSGQITEREFGADLMTVGEVMSMDAAKAIVFTPLIPPMLMTKFTWQEFDDLTQYPAKPRRILEVDDQLVRACEEAKQPAEWESKPTQKPGQGKSDKPVYDRKRGRGERKQSERPPRTKEPEPVRRYKEEESESARGRFDDAPP
ncbi:MAG: type IV secretory system conjugative DNA transfer family protein [Candidatus Obscuribacterales bacterium]|nr:type IV secretory system conjugative DNA transfer family protein [Candidatus Obscuribacterales bacterium]